MIIQETGVCQGTFSLYFMFGIIYSLLLYVYSFIEGRDWNHIEMWGEEKVMEEGEDEEGEESVLGSL